MIADMYLCMHMSIMCMHAHKCTYFRHIYVVKHVYMYMHTHYIYACVGVHKMWGLFSMKVPDVRVSLGFPSSSGAVNTKAVFAVPILLY